MQSARDERIPGKLICAIVAVGSLAFFGILTETVMNVLFPQLMGVLHISEATIQWLTTGYLLVVSITVPLSAWLRRRFRQRSIFLAATRCSPRCSSSRVRPAPLWWATVISVFQSGSGKEGSAGYAAATVTGA